MPRANITRHEGPPVPHPDFSGWFYLPECPNYIYLPSTHYGSWMVARTRPSFKVIKASTMTGGYVRWTITQPDGTRHTLKRAALICAHVHGPRPSDEHVARHLDNSRTNDDPNNLAWGTQRENTDDRVVHGTIAMRRGENSNFAKLTEEQAIDAIRRSDDHETVADHYGVQPRTIRLLRNGRSWPHLRHLPRPPYRPSA